MGLGVVGVDFVECVVVFVGEVVGFVDFLCVVGCWCLVDVFGWIGFLVVVGLFVG